MNKIGRSVADAPLKREVRYRYKNSVGHLVLRTYPVIRHTAKGVWISVDEQERLVIDSTRKRYAYPTEKEALVNFIKRTERHIMLMQGNIELAKEALYKAKVKEMANG